MSCQPSVQGGSAQSARSIAPKSQLDLQSVCTVAGHPLLMSYVFSDYSDWPMNDLKLSCKSVVPDM